MYKFTDEHRRKIGLASKKRPHLVDLCKRNAKARIGTHLSSQHRKKISDSLKGERSYLWKGGITPLNKKIRHSIEMKLVREAVFKRDNYTCQKCGNRGCELHPHHIKSFSKFPELRFELSNIITLCKGCHEETDTYASKGRW